MPAAFCLRGVDLYRKLSQNLQENGELVDNQLREFEFLSTGNRTNKELGMIPFYSSLFLPRYGLSLKRQKNRLAKYERSSHVSINWLRTLEITRKNNFWLLNVKCLLKSNKQMYLLYVASILQIKNWGGSLEGIGWKNEKKIMTSSSTATNKRKGKIKGVPH